MDPEEKKQFELTVAVSYVVYSGDGSADETFQCRGLYPDEKNNLTLIGVGGELIALIHCDNWQRAKVTERKPL